MKWFCNSLKNNHNTIVEWNMYMREVCEYTLTNNSAKIGGVNTTVEIDESCFSKRGICRETKETFLVPVPDRSARTLLPIIIEHVAAGTTIITDEWRSYQRLDQTFHHMTVNHSINFVDPNTLTHTNTIESSWGKIKSRNKKQWGTYRPMLNSYLVEYMWRKRYGPNNLFETMLQHIAHFMPPQSK
ncbi:putative transposase-like protein HI 1328.1 [Aphis craccivora]|uniref:Putative transposase-like protein HI 1328.1 n=1 Tax=Aphis craccivora TaxID=307492 RepID=A0A6G0XCT7_APHCR|nr:putative transposase-like protein HI 1328.1 [Aphis craccivora]